MYGGDEEGDNPGVIADIGSLRQLTSNLYNAIIGLNSSINNLNARVTALENNNPKS